MRQGSSLTPMFRQYHALKRNHPDAILLFRMGDFYEMFHEDAKLASRVLELTLTARGKGSDNVVPMCGFPHHQLDNYTARLVRASHRVAICDQVEDPKKAQGLVRREVVRMVTPGTVNDPNIVDAKENIWMASLAAVGERLGAAFLDASTGELLAWEAPGEGDPWGALAERIGSFVPAEIVYPEGFCWSESFRRERGRRAVLTEADPYAFASESAARLLGQHFGVASLDGFGLRNRAAAIAAAGGLLSHVRETQHCELQHVHELRLHEPANHVLMDAATGRNLELIRSLRDDGREGSLLRAIDATVTSAGGRLLRRWLLAPLLDPERIRRRQDVVAELLDRPDRRHTAREQLKRVHDIERLLARAVSGTANARDLLGLRTSLERVPELTRTLDDLRAPLARDILDGIDPCADVAQRLAEGLVDEPPATLRDGGVIRDGFSPELDELRSILRDGKSFIASLEAKEREARGIASLKVRYNKVFGYFIEVTKANLHRVPEHYVRKQTIASGERYVTAELKEYESKVLHAQERAQELELSLFNDLRSGVAAEARRIKTVSGATARLDLLAALAEIAAQNNYCRPRVDDSNVLRIVGGRHPVVEQTLVDERFVPNDTNLAIDGRAIALLTGPNMGGKSTYLRQVALIVLMAQCGSFVPADEAEIGVVDRVFCRVGASDSLADGQSTFMVEMSETANILHNASTRSLLLLDEIGRGTATFDGLSIAWAVVEHLHALPGGAPRTLFATHYHELTELAVELSHVLNLRLAVREHGDRVIFLHRVEEGAADRSYGIQVARLAGVPEAVVRRAREVLDNLERDEYGRDGLPRRARRSSPGERRIEQPPLFGLFEPQRPPASEASKEDERATEVLTDLRRQVPDRLTPIDALQLLSKWKDLLDTSD